MAWGRERMADSQHLRANYFYSRGNGCSSQHWFRRVCTHSLKKPQHDIKRSSCLGLWFLQPSSAWWWRGKPIYIVLACGFILSTGKLLTDLKKCKTLIRLPVEKHQPLPLAVLCQVLQPRNLSAEAERLCNLWECDFARSPCAGGAGVHRAAPLSRASPWGPHLSPQELLPFTWPHTLPTPTHPTSSSCP